MTTTTTVMTTQEVATRFNELAQQEKWFDIHDELFADNVRSVDPAHSRFFAYAEGKAAVRKKGEDFVKGVTAAHRRFTSPPIVTANHFAVVREVDITHTMHGRIQINEIMFYEVKDGKIVLEQFVY
jgi:hypothetical protein